MFDGSSKGTLDRRRAGILLHITSLPGGGSTGDLGPSAYQFVDFLQNAGIGVWQMLPIGPTQPDGSPYQTSSMHAGDPRLISLQSLVDEGWVEPEVLEREQISDQEKALHLLEAWRAFDSQADEDARGALARFVHEEGHGL
jgi:4-alpha-glucanotransferase